MYIYICVCVCAGIPCRVFLYVHMSSSMDAIIPCDCGPGPHRISASWFTKALFITLLRPIVTHLGRQIAFLAMATNISWQPESPYPLHKEAYRRHHDHHDHDQHQHHHPHPHPHPHLQQQQHYHRVYYVHDILSLICSQLYEHLLADGMCAYTTCDVSIAGSILSLKLQVRDGRHVRLGDRVDLEPATLQTEDGPWAIGGHRTSRCWKFFEATAGFCIVTMLGMCERLLGPSSIQETKIWKLHQLRMIHLLRIKNADYALLCEITRVFLCLFLWFS